MSLKAVTPPADGSTFPEHLGVRPANNGPQRREHFPPHEPFPSDVFFSLKQEQVLRRSVPT